MWFSEYLFLERSWAKDENTLKVSLNDENIFMSIMYMDVHTRRFFSIICVFSPFPSLTGWLNLNWTSWTSLAGRSSTAEGFPSALLAGTFCGGYTIYSSKAFGCSRICCFSRDSRSKECFDSSYKGFQLHLLL